MPDAGVTRWCVTHGGAAHPDAARGASRFITGEGGVGGHLFPGVLFPFFLGGKTSRAPGGHRTLFDLQRYLFKKNPKNCELSERLNVAFEKKNSNEVQIDFYFFFKSYVLP